MSGFISAILTMLDLHINSFISHATLAKGLDVKRYFFNFNFLASLWKEEQFELSSLELNYNFLKTYLKEPRKLNRTILFEAASTSNDDKLFADSSDLINNQ